MVSGVPTIKVTSNHRSEPSEQARLIKQNGAVASDATTEGDGDGDAQAQQIGEDVPVITDGQDASDYQPPPTVKRKGSTAGIGVDPLTAHILQRTGTDATSNGNSALASMEGVTFAGLGSGRKSAELIRRGADATIAGPQKEKKKGVSFLSRFMGGGRKNRNAATDDDEGADGETRTEGMDADVFSQPIGYIPQHPPPPKYIRVRSHNKGQHEFNNIFLAQELSWKYNLGANGQASATSTTNSAQSTGTRSKGGAIWVMQFSKDGKYLAAGGKDKVVLVWQVIGTEEERIAHEREEDAAGSDTSGIHSGSCGGMRLNAPVFRREPVQEYHGHTADILDLSWSKNQFLLSSSMDKTVRLWHVTKKECLCCFQHSDFVTSIVFHPIDDRFFLAGSLDSKLRLWSIPDKSVAFWNEVPDLITAVAFSPDGKIAIAGCLSGLCLFYETEGLKYHTQIQVRSSIGRNAKGSKITGIETSYFPPDDPNGDVKILVTSNDSRVRMYNLRDKSLDTKFKGYENTCSQIHATLSDDGKYIICGSEDRKVYIWNVAPGGGEKKNKRPVEYFEAHSAIVTVALLAPTRTRQLLGSSRDPIYDLCNPPPVMLVSKSEMEGSTTLSTPTTAPMSTAPSTIPHLSKVMEEPAPATSRTLHSDGNIIVSADYTGQIKVFRQDCAYLKRKNEQWETGSTLSRKLGVVRRESLNRHSGEVPQRGLRSWRSSIASDISAGGTSMRSSNRNSFGGGIYDSRQRSVSPRLSMATISAGNTRTGYQTPEGRSRAQSLNSTVAPRLNGHSRGNSVTSMAGSARGINFPTPGAANRENYEAQQRRGMESASTSLNAGSSADPSVRARNSSEDSDPENDEGHMVCHECGGTSFLAKKSKQRDQLMKLQCAKCDTIVL